MAPSQILSKLYKNLIYALLFLIPIFSLPFAQNVLDLPKQLLALILFSASLIIFLLKQILEKKLSLKKNTLFYFFIFLIFITNLISLFLSPNFNLSFFGLPDKISDSFLSIILFLVFSLFLFSFFDSKIELLYAIFSLLAGTALAGIFNLFQIYNIFLLPLDFTKFPSFNFIGTPNAFSLFSSIFLPVSLILFFKTKEGLKTIFSAISLILFLNIILVNFKTAWFVLGIEILILFIFGFGEKIKIGFILSLMALLIISLFFYFFPFPPPFSPNLPPEISLSFPAEIFIIKNAFSQNLKNLFFGSGPSTFAFAYSLYRSPLLNQTIFWGTRFVSGHSAFSDLFLTRGIIGGISILLFYLFCFFSIFKNLGKKEKTDEFFEIKIALSCSLIGAIVASLFYPFNFSFWLIFWFLVGAVFFVFVSQSIAVDLSSSGKMLIFNTAFVFVLISSLVLIFLQGKNYLAESYYLKGLKAFQKNQVDLAIEKIQKAINFNSSLDHYWRDLSQIYLAKATSISQDKNLEIEEKRKLANLNISLGGNAINRAISIFPQNVANWNVRGFFYQNLIGLEGAEKIALDSYQRAIQLEPSSPYPYGEKGRVYILMAQEFAKRGDEKSQKEYLNFAISILNKALELKPDYAPAHYLLAVAYDQSGETDQAISKLEETKLIAPNDFGLRFQLGFLYWRKKETQKAKSEFEEVLKINPDYSNARYMLGLVYDQLGEKDKALLELEKVLAHNPDNSEIKKIIENIKNGLPALEGIVTTSPGISETPPEVKR